jgi:REP element-mobilizing transposase RayT
MSRRLRFIPEGGALVEVTHRALHSRLLFRPSPLLNQIIIGTLARAKRRYKVRVCFFVAASNHLHLYLDVDDAEQLSRFMGYFGSKLAREVGRLTGWKQKIFGRRYQAIVVSPEEAAQIDRLRYGLAHGAKEDLVDRPRDWPGVHAVRALLEGEVLEGLWFDRTQEYATRRRGEKFEPLQYATREVLELDPLPCWKDLTEEQRRVRVAALWRTSRPKPRPGERRRPSSLWVQRPFWPRTLSGGRRRPRSPPRRPSTRQARPCAASSGTPTPCSWLFIAKPPRSSGSGSRNDENVGSLRRQSEVRFGTGREGSEWVSARGVRAGRADSRRLSRVFYLCLAGTCSVQSIAQSSESAAGSRHGRRHAIRASAADAWNREQLADSTTSRVQPGGRFEDALSRLVIESLASVLTIYAK